jgi:hypothetical protein
LSFLPSSFIAGLSFSLGTSTLLSSLSLQFGLLLSNLGLGIILQSIESGLGIGSGLLLSICTSLSSVSGFLQLLDGEHSL